MVADTSDVRDLRLDEHTNRNEAAEPLNNDTPRERWARSGSQTNPIPTPIRCQQDRHTRSCSGRAFCAKRHGKDHRNLKNNEKKTMSGTAKSEQNARSGCVGEIAVVQNQVKAELLPNDQHTQRESTHTLAWSSCSWRATRKPSGMVVPMSPYAANTIGRAATGSVRNENSSLNTPLSVSPTR